MVRCRKGADRERVWISRNSPSGRAVFIQSAQSLALREGNQQFVPEHLLKVLLDDEEGLAARLINAAGGRDTQARTATEAALKKLPKIQGGSGQVYLGQDTAKLLDNAEQTAKRPATLLSPPNICCWR